LRVADSGFDFALSEMMPSVHDGSLPGVLFFSCIVEWKPGPHRDDLDLHENSGRCQRGYLNGASRRFVGLGFGAEKLGVASVETREVHLALLRGIAYQVDVHHYYVGHGKLLRRQGLLNSR